MEKNSFIFYKSFKEAIDLCPADVKLSIYEAIAEYALTEQEPTITNPYGLLCWKLIRPQLEANWRRYKNGQNGGAPKGNRNAAKPQPTNNRETTEEQPKDNHPTDTPTTETQANINANVKEKDNGKVKDKEEGATPGVTPTRARFTPPSVSEVEEYCRERANGIDAQQFCDHYTANGWKQKGGNPIKDWRAAVRTWERNGINHSTQPQDKQPERYGSGEPTTSATATRIRHTSPGLLGNSELLKYQQELNLKRELNDTEARYLEEINEEVRKRGIATRHSTI